VEFNLINGNLLCLLLMVVSELFINFGRKHQQEIVSWPLSINLVWYISW